MFFFCRFDFTETSLENLFGALAWSINGWERAVRKDAFFLFISADVFMNDNLWLERE